MPITTSLAKRLIKWLIQHPEYAGWTTLMIAQGYDALTSDAPAELEGRKASLVFRRASASGVQEDVAVVTFHFINYTNGVPDGTWIDADFTSLETRFTTLWNALKPYYGAHITLDTIRWHRFGPSLPKSPKTGLELSGPAVRQVVLNSPGTAVGTALHLPPQVALTVTERVIPRALWGRTYWPAGIATSTWLDTYGRAAGASIVALLANQMRDLYQGARADDFMPVVYSPALPSRARRDGTILPARPPFAHPIQSVSADDVFDVIRSRRFDRPVSRTTNVLTP